MNRAILVELCQHSSVPLRLIEVIPQELADFVKLKVSNENLDILISDYSSNSHLVLARLGRAVALRRDVELLLSSKVSELSISYKSSKLELKKQLNFSPTVKDIDAFISTDEQIYQLQEVLNYVKTLESRWFALREAYSSLKETMQMRVSLIKADSYIAR